MAQRTWIGNALVAAQVDRLTPGGTIEVGDKFVCTLTDESGATQAITVSASGTSVSSACADITTAWNASTLSLFVKCTAANVTTYVSVTADTAGVPFYLAATTTESDNSGADGQTFTQSTTTLSSGPTDYNCLANWTQNTIPASTNDVLISGSSSILYGLRQSGVAINKFAVDSGYSGSIGYAGAPLSIDPDAFTVDGGRTMYFNVNSAAIPARVSGGTRCTLNGSGLTTVTVEGGTVMIGIDPGDSATLTTLSVLQGGTAYVGPSATITNFKQAGGTGHLFVAATAVDVQSGTLTTYGTGAIGTVTNSGGTAYLNSTGTITTLNAYAGISDLSRVRVTRTVTTLNHRKPATVIYDTSVVTVGTYSPSGLVSLAAN